MSQNMSKEPLQPQQLPIHESSINSNQLGQQQSTVSLNQQSMQVFSSHNHNNLNQHSQYNQSSSHNQSSLPSQNQSGAQEVDNSISQNNHNHNDNDNILINIQNQSLLPQQPSPNQSNNHQNNNSSSPNNNSPSQIQQIYNSKNSISLLTNQLLNDKINPDTFKIVINSQIGLQNFIYSFDHGLEYLQSEPTKSKLKTKLEQQRNKNQSTYRWIEQNITMTNINNQNQKQSSSENVLELLNQPTEIIEQKLKQESKINELNKEKKQNIYKKFSNSHINQYIPEHNYITIQVYFKQQNQQKQKCIKSYKFSRDIIELTKIRYKQKGMIFTQKTFIQQLGILFSMYNQKIILFQIKAIQNILLGQYHHNQRDLIKTIVSFMYSQNDDKSLQKKIQESFDLLQKFLQDLIDISDISSQIAKQFDFQMLKHKKILFPFLKNFFIQKFKSKMKQAKIKQAKPISLYLKPANLINQNNQNILFSSQQQQLKKIKQIEKNNIQQQFSQSMAQEIQSLLATIAPNNILSAGSLTERLKLLFFIAGGGFQNISRCFRAYNKSQTNIYRIFQKQILEQKPMVLDFSINLTLLGFLAFDFDLQWNDVGVLDLQQCSIRDQVFNYMIKYISNFKNLRTFYLKNNQITEFTRQYLQNIKKNTKTTYINLRNIFSQNSEQNNLSKQSIKCIKQFLLKQQKDQIDRKNKIDKKKISKNQQQSQQLQQDSLNRIITIQFDDQLL